MSAAAIPATVLPRVGALVRMLGSPIDGEALNAARALGRTLAGVGVDLHALADRIERPPEPVVILRDAPEPGRRPRRSREARAGDVDLDYARRRNVIEALRRGLNGGRMTEWEETFAASIVERLSVGRGLLTERQGETLSRLLGKIGEGRAWV